jgi:hypothetical protein
MPCRCLVKNEARQSMGAENAEGRNAALGYRI